MNSAANLKRNEKDSIAIFEERTLEKDYRTLIPLLQPGLRVLDVGCGSGAITCGLLKYVGEHGCVIGIDADPSFIKKAQLKSQGFKNLEFVHQDLFSFEHVEKFDLIIASRTLQWISDTNQAIGKMKQLLKPGGQLSILDYDHLKIEWNPSIPDAMKMAYNAFLSWRLEGGLNNQIIVDLPDFLMANGLSNIQVFEANETYEKGDPNFMSKLGMWEKVVAMPQILDEGYLDEETIKQALLAYGNWKRNEARGMILKLKEVRGINLL
ncbi:MAG: class I SAM-dependent methyltransferase [Cyclobacterium sp.]|uniref:class I SAM-dependent methyltransferase n=1 Tax=unclassified Cyclobacterium TaxID=2615055 RepID=UPI0013CF88DF|nr:class I SAM-dependent methyltransferase [Cyclobacterium sp. SYSU L10401]